MNVYVKKTFSSRSHSKDRRKTKKTQCLRALLSQSVSQLYILCFAQSVSRRLLLSAAAAAAAAAAAIRPTLLTSDDRSHAAAVFLQRALTLTYCYCMYFYYYYYYYYYSIGVARALDNCFLLACFAPDDFARYSKHM